MDKKKILLANKVVFEFIMNLSTSELKDLLNNNDKLILIRNEDTIDNKKVEDKTVIESINSLMSISSREKSLKYLSKLKVVDLKKIAKELNIFIKSKSKKSEIIDRIVEGTIGAKIKIDILKS